jgi:hypothetical protein|tara:strand:+ start:217 stop:639 length:423 start_codon:yes stop_codon:yes gene_type:complete
MASIYRDIRAALETKLKAVSGLPSISYENSSYDRKNGTSYVETFFVPQSRRPAVRGLNPQQRYNGVFTVVCYAPEGNGPGAADELADKVLDAFEATTDASFINSSGDSIVVSIDYAEREGGGLDTPFYYVPVNIGFYIYN